MQLFYANKEATPRQYRVSKREEFVQALQVSWSSFLLLKLLPHLPPLSLFITALPPSLPLFGLSVCPL